MIQLKEAKKIYKNGRTEYPALNGIDLTIENGEYVAIIGTSGSGKKYTFKYHRWDGSDNRWSVSV